MTITKRVRRLAAVLVLRNSGPVGAPGMLKMPSVPDGCSYGFST